MKIPNTVANVIASTTLSVLFAILYLIVFAPPEWAWAGATFLMAAIVYFYCSLIDALREYGVQNAE